MAGQHIDKYLKENRSDIKCTGISEMAKSTKQIHFRLNMYRERTIEDADKSSPQFDWHYDRNLFSVFLRDIMFKNGRLTEHEENMGVVINDRSGNKLKVLAPEDCYALIGSKSLHILTAGEFGATAHAVHVSNIPGTKRYSIINFFHPEPETPMDVPDKNYTLPVVEEGDEEVIPDFVGYKLNYREGMMYRDWNEQVHMSYIPLHQDKKHA